MKQIYNQQAYRRSKDGHVRGKATFEDLVNFQGLHSEEYLRGKNSARK